MIMKVLICLVWPAVSEISGPNLSVSPTFDLAVKSAPPCGEPEFIGGYLNYTNSSPGFNATNLTEGIYAAYDCLCGNRNTKFIQDCKMGNTCMLNGACIPACEYNKIGNAVDCACSRGTPSTNLVNDLASQSLTQCALNEICIGPFTPGLPTGVAAGDCIEQCTEGVKTTSDCACATDDRHGIANYCKDPEVCIKGSCLEECSDTQTTKKCACGSTACAETETCVENECVKECTVGEVGTGPCMCVGSKCSEGNVCKHLSSSQGFCEPKCTEFMNTGCWCTVDYKSCYANTSCSNNVCVRNCDGQAADNVWMFPTKQCMCGTSVCTEDFPWCLDDRCVPSCVAGANTKFCRCDNVGWCNVNTVCDTGSCKTPTAAPTTTTAAPLGQGILSSDGGVEHEVVNGVGKENLFLVCMISFLLSSV